MPALGRGPVPVPVRVPVWDKNRYLYTSYRARAGAFMWGRQITPAAACRITGMGQEANSRPRTLWLVAMSNYARSSERLELTRIKRSSSK